MQRNTGEDMSIPGNVFDFQSARRDPDELHNTSKNLATSSGILRREGIEKSVSEEPLQSIPLPWFQGRARQNSLDDRNCLMSLTNHATGIGTCTQSGMTIPSYLSSEMHLGKFPDHTEFQSWIVNFRTEVCSKARNPTLALHLIKEIEAAKSLDDFITLKSITGKYFPDYEELDLVMAAALKRCYDKQTHFWKKISVEEQRAQKDNRFLTGRQVAHSIHECFGPTGSDDEIQDFDLRWEHALLPTSDLPSDNVLDGLYVSKLEISSQTQTIMALYLQEILRMWVKLHIEQTQRSKNFRIQNEITERGAVTKGKGQNPSTKRKTG